MKSRSELPYSVTLYLRSFVIASVFPSLEDSGEYHSTSSCVIYVACNDASNALCQRECATGHDWLKDCSGSRYSQQIHGRMGLVYWNAGRCNNLPDECQSNIIEYTKLLLGFLSNIFRSELIKVRAVEG